MRRRVLPMLLCSLCVCVRARVCILQNTYMHTYIHMYTRLLCKSSQHIYTHTHMAQGYLASYFKHSRSPSKSFKNTHTHTHIHIYTRLPCIIFRRFTHSFGPSKSFKYTSSSISPVRENSSIATAKSVSIITFGRRRCCRFTVLELRERFPGRFPG